MFLAYTFGDTMPISNSLKPMAKSPFKFLSLKYNKSIWRGYKDIKDAGGWLSLVFVGSRIYRFWKYRVSFEKSLTTRLERLLSSLEVARYHLPWMAKLIVHYRERVTANLFWLCTRLGCRRCWETYFCQIHVYQYASRFSVETFCSLTPSRYELPRGSAIGEFIGVVTKEWMRRTLCKAVKMKSKIRLYNVSNGTFINKVIRNSNFVQ